MAPPTIRDLLYFDFDKAASIWSQFEEGLLERMSVTEDAGKDRNAGTKFSIPGVAEASLGVDYIQKRSILQSKTLHHDLLNRVELSLRRAGLVTDLSEQPSSVNSADLIRHAIGGRPYLCAAGNSVLEDYQRILAIAEKFNEIIAFIGKASSEGLKKSPEYLQLMKQIDEQHAAAEQIHDRNQKAKAKAQVSAMRRQLQQLVKVELTTVDDWLVDGMRLFINTFMRTRINFRIYPFAHCPSFQVLCNLKRDCFVDSDLEHLLYGYGNKPNVSLAVFGLITSLPPKENAPFNPLKEFEDDPELAKSAAFEQAFRGVFGGMEGMESIVRFSRYPNVTVHPIAVYRSFAMPPIE
jgi:hypothetical protein